MTTLLVTGGAGFIGSNFIRYIQSKYPEYCIVNVDLLTYAGNQNNLKGIKTDEKYSFYQGDIVDREFMTTIFGQHTIDGVIHFAAESHVDNSIETPEVFVRTNIMGTQTLLECAKTAWSIGVDEVGYPIYREGVKFLQVSTDEVYGSLDSAGCFTEGSPIQPNSPYSSSKAGADLMVRAYGKTYHLPVNITRCSNNYGPFQHQEKLIPLMINRALKNESLPVYGDGLQIRDWLHVEDHCSGIDVVFHQGQIGEVYNIGGGHEQSNIHIVQRILHHLDKPETLITYVQDRLGHDRRYAIDSSKLSQELGWKPVHTFEEGLAETINWYARQENNYLSKENNS
jgi:dTDP-glucose 4,6-dehydratase